MTEFDENESEVRRLLQESPFDDAARPEHREVLRRRVLEEFERANGNKVVARIRRPSVDSWRQIMRKPVPRFIAIFIVCLLITLTGLIFPGHQTRLFAFEKLASTIVDARTAKFQMEIRTEGMPTQHLQACFMAPGKYRIEMPFLGAGSIAVSDEATGKQLTLMPATKTAIIVTSTGVRRNSPPGDPFGRLRDLLNRNRDAKNDTFKPIGEKVIDGKTVTGFQSSTAMGVFTIWGEIETGHVFRAETIFTGPKRTEAIMTDFEFDVELDEKEFEMTPPADFTVQSMEVDVSPASEQDFVNALKLCGDLSKGELPGSISFLEPMTFMFKHAEGRLKKLKDEGKGTDLNEIQKAMTELRPIQRGFQFALELPDSADAHYAGNGVRCGTPDTPIFWYRRSGSARYRIIHADLSIKEDTTAPEIKDAKRLIRPKSQEGSGDSRE